MICKIFGFFDILIGAAILNDFISSSEINLNLSASREEWKLVYIPEAQP